LAEEYKEIFGNDVDVQGGGSSAGITAAESGTAEIGMSSRDLKDKEQGMWSVVIAKDGLAIIKHPDNPISNLTLEQVRDIYAAKITNWNELGGLDAKIHIIAREEGSGTRSAFEELVMDETYIAPKAIIQDSNGAVRQLVADDPNSIGFISLGLVDDTVKASLLDGVAPTSENVTNGVYSLYRPFLFVTNGEPTGLTNDFIDFVLSKEGQQLLINEGLVPVIDIVD
jgi:phosphate transport system substrate-binding protein